MKVLDYHRQTNPRACLFTCRAFFPRSRMHLQRSPTLSSDRQVGSFARTMRSRPQWAHVVESLSLGNVYDRPTSLSVLPLSSCCRTALALCFLHGILGSDTHASFLMACTSFRSLRRLNLHSTYFETFGYFTRLLRCFSSLKHLELHDVDCVAPGHYVSSPAQPKIPQIETLVVGGSRSATISMMVELLFPWLVAARAARTISELRYTGVITHSVVLLLLTATPSLTFIELSGSVVEDVESPVEMLPYAWPQVSRIHPPRTIRTHEIWKDLHQVASSISRLPSLVCFVLSICIKKTLKNVPDPNTYRPANDPDLQEWFRTQPPEAEKCFALVSETLGESFTERVSPPVYYKFSRYWRFTLIVKATFTRNS